MRTKERILSIRLMEKARAHPVWAEALGIVITQRPAKQKNQTPTHLKRRMQV